MRSMKHNEVILSSVSSLSAASWSNTINEVVNLIQTAKDLL